MSLSQRITDAEKRLTEKKDALAALLEKVDDSNVSDEQLEQVTTANKEIAQEERGLSIDKNDLLLDPAKMLPPPKISGRLRAVTLEPDRLVQEFGEPDSLAPMPYFGSDHPARNYMHYEGGTMRFGRLTMTPADLLLVDSDPSNPFEFSLAHYHEQLVAGSHRTTPEDALVVSMPDYPAPSLSTR